MRLFAIALLCSRADLSPACALELFHSPWISGFCLRLPLFFSQVLYFRARASIYTDMCGPCSFTPIHSLTGPVGQPFASRLEGSGSHPGDEPTLTMEPGSPVSNVFIGDPDVIRSLASSPFSGCFTRLHANYVKRRRLCHPSAGSFTKLRANYVKSQHDHTSHAFLSSILLLAGPPPYGNTLPG